MIFGSVPALACGAAALGLTTTAINVAASQESTIPRVEVLLGPFGFLVALSSLAILVELFAVILRICVSTKHAVFHVIMIILEFLLMFLYMAGCGISVAYGLISLAVGGLIFAIPLYISAVS